MTKPTQLAAWDAMQPVLPSHHAAVLTLLRSSGRTAAEVAVHLKCSMNQAAARLRELVERGHVRDSGTTRVNADTHRKNIVWVICEPPVAPQKNKHVEISVKQGDPNKPGEACGWFATFKGDPRKPRPAGKGLNWRAAALDLIRDASAEPPNKPECK